MLEIATFPRTDCGKCEILCNSSENSLPLLAFCFPFAPFSLHTPNGPRNAGFSSSPRPPHWKILCDCLVDSLLLIYSCRFTTEAQRRLSEDDASRGSQP